MTLTLNLSKREISTSGAWHCFLSIDWNPVYHSRWQWRLGIRVWLQWDCLAFLAFLGGEYPTESLDLADGVHPINHVGPKKLDWTVAV